MRRNAHALTIEADWEGVTSDHPCPVCAGSRGCSTHSNAFVSCERTPSQWPLTTGAWLHRLESSAEAVPAESTSRATPESAARAPVTAALAGTRL